MEKDHKISVHASLIYTEWLEKKFNIIDTPGYMDFISEALVALQVGDLDEATVARTLGVVLKHASDQQRAVKELKLAVP